MADTTVTNATFSTRETAQILGVSIRTLKRWLKNGVLKPVIKLANGYNFYSQFQLENFKGVTKSNKNIIGTMTNMLKSVTPFSKVMSPTYDKPMTQIENVIGLIENVTPFTNNNVNQPVTGKVDIVTNFYEDVTPLEKDDVGKKNPIGFQYQSGDTKKATDTSTDTHAAQNFNFNSDDNTKFSVLQNNLPTEISCLQRFIPVGNDKKTPRGKGWQYAENQKFLTDIVTSNAAFFIANDYLVLDFDNVLDNEGNFSNTRAEDFYKYLRVIFPTAYFEKSVGGHGLHFLLRPSDSVFGKISGKTLKFDSNSCVEVFYNFNKTITLTGNLYHCAAKAEIPTGEIADDFITELLLKIERQNGKKYRRYNSDNSFADSDEYKNARALAMLDCILMSQLDYDEWLSVMTSCKNLGIKYDIVDAKNAQDTERYNAEKNQATWFSISNTSIGIANLHAKAKRFGYIDKDFFNDWKVNHADTSRSSRADNDFSDFEEQTSRPATTKAVIADCPIDLRLPSSSVYRFTDKGILRYVAKNEKFVPCCHTPIVVTNRFILQPSYKIQYEVAFLNHNSQWCFVTVDGSFIADSRKIIQLADSGVGITSTDAKYLSAFLMELINFDGNKSAIPTQKIFSQIGWRDSNCKQFILPTGGNIDGENYIVKRNNYNYDEIFATKGDKEKWRRAYLELLLHSANVRLIFGAALLSPLVKPLNLMNVWLHIHGTSNNGKTLATKAAVSPFGNPELKFLGRTLDASRANFQSVAVGLNDFPKYFDEMESLPKKAKEDLPNWIYNFSGGITGQRNKRNGEERETSFFSGTIFTTGEQPLLTDNSKRGAFKRLLEIKLDKVSDDQTMRQFHKFFEKNFGHFGTDWINYITDNLESLQVDFDELLNSKFQSDALNDYDATNLKVIFACQFALQKFFTGVLEKADSEITFDDLHTENDLQELLQSLPTISQIDDSERAWLALADFVNAHPKNFVRQIQPTSTGVSEVSAEGYETYGKIYLNGDVAFFKTELTRILEKELDFSSGNKLISEWKDYHKLDTNKDSSRTDKNVRIAGSQKRVIYCKQLINPADE